LKINLYDFSHKTNIMKKKKFVFMLIAAAFLLAACQKGVEKHPSNGLFYKDASTETTKMIAGGGQYDDNCTGIEVGTITIIDDGTTITVKYEITETGWLIDETHLYVGPEEDIPANNGGNPKIGQFPYGGEYDPGLTSVTIVISGDDYPECGFVVAAHAAVSTDTEDETAWGYGRHEGYCDQDGADGISFTDSPYYGGSRWGWYIYGTPCPNTHNGGGGG